MPKTYEEYVKDCKAKGKLPCGEQVWGMIATVEALEAGKVPGRTGGLYNREKVVAWVRDLRTGYGR